MLAVIRYELTRGLAYWRLSHPNASIYVWKLPLLVTAVSLFLFYFMPGKPPLLGKDGLLSSVLSVVATLPGFYFAGLAAVSTFTNVYIDREMPNPAPEMKIMIGGSRISTKLTRRQFLSYVFSYLVIISFSLCILLLVLNATAGTIKIIKPLLLGWAPIGIYVWFALKGARWDC